MLQGHDEILPAYRYRIGLGLTLLLCGGGLVCACVNAALYALKRQITLQ
jgi:hypothetical protein